MQIEALQRNEQLRQHEFPVVKTKIFLGHAGDCPLPRRVAQAISDYAFHAAAGDQEAAIWPQAVETGRALGARLLHCAPDEIAFVGPTSLALSFFASGLKFRKGDNILVYHDDYPSNVYPWLALAEQGVQVRLLNTRSLGAIRSIDVLGQVDEQTKLVALASCHFVSGYRLDYATIGAALRQRHILFCLDGIQTVGAFPMTMESVDLLAADAHKWLLGPCGAGLMFVKKDLQPQLNPPIYGWHNVRCPNFVTQEKIEFNSGAKKFEAGTHNLLGLVGLNEAMRMLLEVGVENIAADLLHKRALLVPALQAKGYTVLHADAGPVNASGIVTFFKPATDMAAVHQRLLDAHIVTSLRSDRQGQRYIRLSPHFYNTDAELQRVLELL